MRAALVIAAALVVAPALLAQSASDLDSLRGQLRERYDILALQDGVGLVPHARGRVRLVEVHGGTVTVDGLELTGRELRDRLGADADLILRVSYLRTTDQRALAQAPAAAGAPETPSTQPAPPEPPPLPAPPARTGRHRGDVVRVGGSVRVDADETVDGDVAVIMGSATVDGHVTGDVAVVMGSLTLGPDAIIEGDVSTVGGSISRASGSRVDGKVSNVGLGPMAAGGRMFPGFVMAPFAWRVGSLAATLWRVAILAVLALLALAVGRTWVEQIADHAAVDPWRAGLIGFFAEILLFPLCLVTIIVLAVSIIGIPLLLLLPFAFLALLVVLLVGFTGVAYQVGRVLNARFGWGARGPYATVAIGVIVVAALTILARSAAIVGGGLLGFPLGALGFLVEYAAWTIGFGSAIQVWMRRRRGGVTPPPLPA
jgi:hypothetical protein